MYWLSFSQTWIQLFFKGAGRFKVKEKVGRVALNWMLSWQFSCLIQGINDDCSNRYFTLRTRLKDWHSLQNNDVTCIQQTCRLMQVQHGVCVFFKIILIHNLTRWSRSAQSCVQLSYWTQLWNFCINSWCPYSSWESFADFHPPFTQLKQFHE